MVRVAIILFIGIVCISTGSIFIKYTPDVPSVMISTWRVGIAAIILLSINRMRGVRLSSVEPGIMKLGLLGGFFLAMHFVTWVTSLKYTSVASSVVLVTTNPIFVGIFSWIALRQKQPPALVIGIVLSVIGSVTLAVGDAGFGALGGHDAAALTGDGLALAGAVMASGYLIVGSIMREKLDVLAYTAIVYSVAAVFLLGASLALGLPFTGYAPKSYAFLVAMALIPQMLGHTAFNWALKYLKTSMVAVSILGEPIGATVMAFFLFGETVGGMQFFGIVMIATAIITASRSGKKEEGVDVSVPVQDRGV